VQYLQVLLRQRLLEVSLVASDEEEPQLVVLQLDVVVIEVGSKLVRLVFVGASMAL